MLDGVVRQVNGCNPGEIVEAVGGQVLDGVVLQVEVGERRVAGKERALHEHQIVVVQMQHLQRLQRVEHVCRQLDESVVVEDEVFQSAQCVERSVVDRSDLVAVQLKRLCNKTTILI